MTHTAPENMLGFGNKNSFHREGRTTTTLCPWFSSSCVVGNRRRPHPGGACACVCVCVCVCACCVPDPTALFVPERLGALAFGFTVLL